MYISQCILSLLKGIDREKDMDTSLVPSLLAYCVINDVISLANLSVLFEDGAYFPVFFVILQDTYRIGGKDWLMEAYKKSNVDVKTLLPGET